MGFKSGMLLVSFLNPCKGKTPAAVGVCSQSCDIIEHTPVPTTKIPFSKPNYQLGREGGGLIVNDGDVFKAECFDVES